MTTGERTESWFNYNLSIPVIMAFYFPFKWIKKTSIKKTDEIDITSGRRELNLAEILAEERAIQAKWPRWKKIYKTVC